MSIPSHQPLTTPSPTEFALAVTVERKVVIDNPECLPKPGDYYRDCGKGLFGKDLNLKWGNWRYVTTRGLDEQGNIVLLFAKGRTQEERNTPFRTTTEHGNHPWPLVLYGISIFQDRSFPQSNGEKKAPRNYARYRYLPAQSEGSRFVKDEFLSEVPFNIPRYTVPITGSVQADYLGLNFSFGDCLHPTIKLPSVRSVLVDTEGESGVLPGQVFPATNVDSWVPYVLSDRQELTNGVYYRVRTRVFPPLEGEEVNA